MYPFWQLDRYRIGQVLLYLYLSREKGRFLTQSYHQNNTYSSSKKKLKKISNNTQKRHQNFDYITIADRFSWSVGIATAHQLVCLNWFAGAQPFQ